MKETFNLLPGWTMAFMWVILIGYIVLMVWIGTIGKKKTKTTADFAIAKGHVKPWWVGICFGATYSSANLFMGVPGWAYSYGESVLWWTLGCFGFTWLGIVVFAKKFWHMGQKSGGALTLPQWLGNRFESQYLRVGVAFLALFNIFYILGQIIGTGTLFEVAMGVPYWFGVCLACVIIVVYIGLGGTYSDVLTDVVQGIIMMGLGALVWISGMWVIGGGLGWMGVMHDKLNAISPNMTAYLNPKSNIFGDWWGIVAVQWLLFSFVLLPHLINKVLALKEEKELWEFLIWSGISLCTMSVFMVWGGLYARVLFADIGYMDRAIPLYLIQAFHPVVSALVIVAVLSAILSTADGLFVAIATIVSNDIYKGWLAPLIHKGISATDLEHKTMSMTRIMIVVVGIASLVLALPRAKSLTYLTQIGISAIISGVVAPLTLSYFWPRANKIGACVSFTVGALTYILLFFGKLLPKWHCTPFKALSVATLVGFAVMIVVCYVTSPMAEEKLRQWLPNGRAKVPPPA